MNLRQEFLKKWSPTFRKVNTSLAQIEKIDARLLELDRINVRLAKLDEINASLNQFESINAKLEILDKKNTDVNNNIKQISLLYKKIYQEPKTYYEASSNLSIDDYSKMQKEHYENADIQSGQIVGNYEWHESFPYETFLLYKYGDIRYPVFDSFNDKIALDFGCGPGRMVKRMKNIFAKVDGCDISQRLLDEAKAVNQDSDFYLTNGQDLGNTPKNFYDFIYCTISMQHIACYSIRLAIIQKMKEALKENGCITLQMAYNKDFPYTKEETFLINDKLVSIKEQANQANYFLDATAAKGTNGKFDVGIGKNDLENIKKDFLKTFEHVELWFANIDNYFDDLKGAKHNNYWAKDWIFIHAY